MKHFSFTRLAFCLGTMALAMATGAQAEEAGVVRISGRAQAEEVVRITSRDHQTIVRGQSPEYMSPQMIQPVNCSVHGPAPWNGGQSSTTCEPAPDCEQECPEYGPQVCESCPSHSCGGSCVCNWLHEQWANIMCNHYENKAQIRHKLMTSHCRLKYEHYKNVATGRVYGPNGECMEDRMRRPKESRWIRYFLPTGSCGKGSPPFGHYDMVYPVDPGYFDQRDGALYASEATGGPMSVPLPPNVQYSYNYSWGIPSSRLTHIAHPVPYGQGTYGNYGGY